MKILSIQGENLASLHGPFSIDFEASPLDRAGLFAITGPTGAGKSTLLDAICLALYGTTPRLQALGGRSYAIGREEEEHRLNSNDPANLLRKGTAAGFAEVCFLGRDGKRYRASWSVRRARGRVDGRVQKPDVKLEEEASGLPIGRTSTEVYVAIEERVGLSYDQFCRSVLLAQGEFSRFLLAPAKDRAELLERVTGTEIYRHISIACHQRHVEAKKALDLLRVEMDGVRILPPEERERLEGELRSRGEALEAARAQVKEVEEALTWHDTLRRVGALVAEGEAALAASSSAWERAGELRERLARVERVEPLRRPIEEALQAIREEAAALAALEEARGSRGVAEAEQKGAAEAFGAAKAALDGAVQRQVEAAPQLEAARRLDLALDGLRVEVSERAELLEAARSRHAAQQEVVAALRKELSSEEERQQVAGAWLEERADLEPVAAQWERWRAELLRLGEARARLHAAAARAVDLGERIAGLEGARGALAAAAEEAAGALAEAEAAARRSEEAAKGAPRAALRELRGWLERVERQARGLEALAAELIRLREERDAHRREGEAASEEAARLRQEEVKAGARRELLERQLQEAEALLHEARVALGLSEERAMLREGEACPLCGSTEHPWATEGVALSARLAEREEGLQRLRAVRQAAEREGAGAAARAEALEAKQAQAGALAALAETRLEAGLGKWEASRQALFADIQGGGSGGDASASIAACLPVDPAGEGMDALLQRLLAEGEALSAREAEADRLEQDARRERTRALSLREVKEEKEGELRAKEKELQMLAGELREQEALRGRAQAEAASLHGPLLELLASFGGGSEALAGDPVAFAAALDGDVSRWREQERARREAAERVGSLGPRCEAAASLLTEREQAAAAAAAAWQEAQGRLEQQGEARRGVLGGGSVAAFEDALAEGMRLAGEALEAARAREVEASAALTRAATRLEGGETALAKARSLREQRCGTRDRALLEAGLVLEQAEGWLASPAAEVEGWRRTLEELEKARERALTLLEERRWQLEQHQAVGRPPWEQEAAQALHGERKEACAQAEERFHDLRNLLRADDDARNAGAAMLPRLQAAEAEEVKWAGLHDLIGAASGDKFQLFAQGITLEVLLSHANVHLEELAPRYRLERVPGQDLQIQVIDKDMGDEVRAANSLSGGETFLVSLALALGLSGLASRTRVESLFIDEGFGSLDPQTLDLALATLDALQASGRRVGVISHVQGMAERIGVQIQVQPQGSGRSQIQVTAA